MGGDMRLYWAFGPKDSAPAKPLADRVSIEEIPPAPTHVPVDVGPRARRQASGSRQHGGYSPLQLVEAALGAHARLGWQAAVGQAGQHQQEARTRLRGMQPGDALLWPPCTWTPSIRAVTIVTRRAANRPVGIAGVASLARPRGIRSRASAEARHPSCLALTERRMLSSSEAYGLRSSTRIRCEVGLAGKPTCHLSTVELENAFASCRHEIELCP